MDKKNPGGTHEAIQQEIPEEVPVEFPDGAFGESLYELSDETPKKFLAESLGKFPVESLNEFLEQPFT